MLNKLCIVVCEYFESETTAVVESEEFDDVKVLTFSADGDTPQVVSDSLSEIIRTCKGDCDRIHIFGNSCISGLEAIAREPACHIHEMDHCFSLFAGKNIVNRYLNDGAYLLTPGWLKHWRRRIEKSRFNQPTAEEFFGKIPTKLILLDTGIDPKSPDYCREFASRMGLPCEIVLTGLDFFRLSLTKIILEWRLETKGAAQTTALSCTNLPMVDYAIMCDLIYSMTKPTLETDVIKNMFNLFAAIYAANSITYIPLINDKPGEIQSYPAPLADSEAVKSRLLGLSGDYAWNESGSGFFLRINYQDRTLGMLEVNGLAFPEYKGHYQNLSLTLAKVCGNAIANARTYQKCKRIEEELKTINKYLERRVIERTEALVKTNEGLRVAISEHKRTEEKLAESEAKLKAILDNMPVVVYVKDIEGRYLFSNKRFEELFHTERDTLIGKTDYNCHPEEIADAFVANDQKVIEAKIPLEFEEVAAHDDGLHIYVSVKFPLFDSAGAIYAVCGISKDITENKRLESEQAKLREQLYHAQRLESVGRLAGGVAHEFNNALTAIIGYISLIQLDMKKDDPLRDYTEKILSSAERAARLTQSLLIFGRKQISNPRPVHLNGIVPWSNHLMAKLVGEDIEIRTLFTNKDCLVMADGIQIEQVLMNLLTNAKDAMSNGGLLVISTDIVELGDAFIKTHGYGKAGKYALLSVSDTGTGMDKKTKERVFEPFFTTKEFGRGTGLGLAVVYGIIKQHEGYVDVDSEPGKGTTFNIYLPVIESVVEETPSETQMSVNPAGVREMVMIAEDEAAVREVIKTWLEKSGYKVIGAVDGEDAIRKFMENKDTVRLFISDIQMPVKNGREAYYAIKKVKPDIKVIFMSGYSSDVIHKRDLQQEGLTVISKPISPAVLLRMVRDVLDT